MAEIPGVRKQQEGAGVSKKFEDMLIVAREYCAVIESISEGNPDWLDQVSRLLPQLHASIAALSDKRGKNGEYLEPNLDSRFELFSKLRRLLGEKDAYWMEFDTTMDDAHKSGSLADDLTDIYCELKYGLACLDEEVVDPDHILSQWRSGYRLHWGRHLVDAERHLYELSTKNQLAI